MTRIGLRWMAGAAVVLGITCIARPGLSGGGGWLPGSSTPGKKSAYSDTGFTGATAPTLSTSATISKGKKKSVLVVDVTLLVVGASDITISPGISGTGAQMRPTILFGHCDGGGNGLCTISGTFWVDLDAAEAANPDLIVGEPLNVVVPAASSAATLGSLSIAVRLQPK